MVAVFTFRNFLLTLALISTIFSHTALAGGIMLGGTRIIYSATAKQITLPVRNTSEDASFLVQSWVEDATGKKSSDFVVTPPMYVSGPRNENSLRIIYTGKPPANDRETLYYFNSKAIPSIDKKKIESENILLLAAVTRIKLFVRPTSLKMPVKDAVRKINFYRQSNSILIENPSPYYMTLAKMKAGNKDLPDLMVAPFSRQTVNISVKEVTGISYRVLNDFGALTPQINASIQ